jgi:hypothetical protein
MALDFPNTPINGQIYDNYFWDSTLEAWRSRGTEESVASRVTGLESKLDFNGVLSADNYTVAISSATSDSIYLDFSTGAGIVYRSLMLGTVTFTSGSYIPGATKTVFLNSGTSTKSLIFPSTWIFVGVKPTQIAANKTGVLTITSLQSDESSCVAGWAVQV